MQTNGDDILENWEEIDEAGLTNTLRKIQAERETQQDFNSIGSPSSASSKAQTANHLSACTTSEGGQKSQMKLLQRKTTENNSSSNTISAVTLKSPLDDMSATFEPVMMVLHKTEDEYQSVNYTQPINSQTVKILRRPTQSSEPRDNGLRPRQPIKTLQQREQEYAEARLRILGSAKNPEDDVGATNSNGSVASSSSSPTTTTAIISAAPITKGNSNKAQGGQNVYNNHYYQQQQQSYYYQQPTSAYNNRTVLTLPPIQHHQQTWSPVVGGSVSSSALRLQQQQDSILRAPRGPDGSTGFQMRR